MNQEYPHVIAILFIMTCASPVVAHVGIVLRRHAWKKTRNGESR